MSDAKAEDIVTVTNDGITVEKSFEPDDFPVPAIAFTLQSARDETVSVRLVDSVPEEVLPENVGFHPKYGAEFWDIDGNSIVFEREFAPGEEYTTVYGLRGSDADEAEKFMSEPTLESVDSSLESSSLEASETESATEQGLDSKEDVDVSPLELDEGQEGDSTPVDVDMSDEQDDNTDVPESESNDDIDGDDDENRTDTLPDTDNSEREMTGEQEVTGERDPTDSGEPGESDTLLDSLTSEIEAADPDDPELAALRDALGVNITRKSVEARIEHVQSTVADLDAYTDALEEFLDENGDAQTLLDDLQSEYEATAGRIDDIEAKTDTNEDEIAELESELESKLEARLADVEDEIGGLEARLESIEDELSEVVEMRNRLASALGGLGAATDEDPASDDE